MILRLTLDLPEDAAYIRTTRHLSRCLLEDINVTTAIINDVENIVGELCSNVIRHAESKSTHFKVTLEYYEPKVVITVKDTGKGFVMGIVPAVGSSRPDGFGGERTGGYGLSMLEGLSDKLDFTETDPQGTTVRVEKKLLYKTQKDADRATETDGGLGAVAMANTD